MITATQARKASEKTRKILNSDDYTWMCLEDQIERATSIAHRGAISTVFEEKPNCFFMTPVNEVVKKLTDAGFTVEVERFKASDGRRGSMLLNRYYVAW